MGPLLGVILHWMGGLASASFYVPYRGVSEMVLGNVLVSWRILLLDHRSLGFSHSC